MLTNVNLLQGTDSVHDFSTGNTLPLVARPWGMHHWSLQSGRTPWVFNCRQRRLQGIRLTHQPSPWMQDYGCLTILPFTGEPLDSAERMASGYRLADAELRPNYMKARLMRYGVTVEMSPTNRGAVFAFEFRGDEAPRIAFFFDGEHAVHARGEDGVGGMSRYSKDPIPDKYGLFFAGDFSVKPEGFVKTQWGGYLEFALGVTKLELRISASFVDEEQAALDLSREVSGRSLADVESEGVAIWNELLGRFDIGDVSDEQRRLFYSCLYRCLLFPRFLDEVNAAGETVHRSPYDGEVHSGSLCADSGFWDVYRTLYPLLLVAYPETLRRMVDGWMSACRESGWAPKWPSPGPRVCMIGTHFDVFVADLVAKGMTDWDVAEAYAYMHKNAFTLSDDDNFGREGLKQFAELGYVPADTHGHAAACTLDYSYNDFCVGQVARYLGKNEEADALLKRAQNYRNVFDPSVGFMRGRREDGGWLEPFREFQWGAAYIEGCCWQHTFNVPHDVEGLTEIYGGADKVIAKLDQMMTMEPRYDAGTYDYEIHETSEMAAVDFGQYAHSNQPVHGFLFLYALLGQPEKTTHWVHRVCNELYTIDNFPGDEDNGEMAAWYVWACLGVYPQCPGKDEYVAFDALLDEVKVRVPGRSEPLLFGKKHPRSSVVVKHAELLA